MRKVFKMALVSVLLAACKQQPFTQDRYMQYYSTDANGQTRKVKAGNIIYLIKLLPPEYFVLKEQSGEARDDAKFNSRLQELRNNTYFLVKIIDESRKGAAMAPAEKVRLISYYQNEAARYFTLKTGNDLLRPSFVNYEDNYGLAPDNRLLVCFPHDITAGGGLTLQYDDQLYRNTGIHAAYSARELEEMPLLKL